MNYSLEDVVLRPWRETDKTNLMRYANNPKIFNNLTDAFPIPYTEEAASRFLSWANEKEPPHILAITIHDEAIGSIGLHPQTDIFRINCELGYWLAEPYWGQGITSAAVKQMVQYAKENFNFQRVFARPFGSNLASQKVLEKVGFTLEAHFENNVIKNGKLEDILVYGYRF